MADSLRGARGARPRGNSRASSNRNSGAYDDHLQPRSYAQHALRPMDSRFSLNEQFAATRQEYEFGFDDSSSILDRATVASSGDLLDDTLKVDVNPLHAHDLASQPSREDIARNYYELLCLARDASVSPSQVRRAYYRLFRILNSEKLPAQLRESAQSYFARVQAAFETLIEPSRRLEYDIVLSDDEFEDELEDDQAGEEHVEKGTSPAQPPLRLRRQEYQTTTDMGIRLDATKALKQTWRNGPLKGRGRIKALDYSISQTVHTELPALGRFTESGMRSLHRAVAAAGSSLTTSQPIRCSSPVVSISASAYALLEDLFLVPVTLLSDRYQPLLPEMLPRSRLMQLAESRPSALVTARYRQELFWRASSQESLDSIGQLALPDTVVEVETDLLPEPSVTARIVNVVPIEGLEEPLQVELMMNTGRSWMQKSPRVGLALHRRLKDGNAFLCADSGDWSVLPEETCRFFDQFSRMNRRFFFSELPMQISPTVEVGYTFSPAEIGLRTGQALTKPADRGIRGLDMDMEDLDKPTWTASAAVSSSGLASYLRYGRNLLLPFSKPSKLLPFRIEAELCTTRFFGTYLALRGLRRITPFSKLGVEIGISTTNLHLSLYFSRLNNRLKLPLLLSHRPPFHSALLFWTTVLPLAALAALDLLRKPPKPRPTASQLADLVARRRAEADELTAVLAADVQPRQAAERSGGGLVITSAKYACRDAPADEVADVTVAVAALVEGSELVIPAGLRKSQILGFWDPAPLRRKVLTVWYVYRGREGKVEVEGRREVRLPGEEVR